MLEILNATAEAVELHQDGLSNTMGAPGGISATVPRSQAVLSQVDEATGQIVFTCDVPGAVGTVNDYVASPSVYTSTHTQAGRDDLPLGA